MSADLDIVTSHNAAESRYEIHVDGELAGLADYREADGVVAITHTETEPHLQGNGLASRLVRFALDDVRARGLQVLPLCPFVPPFIRRHPEYADLVPADKRSRYRL